jgi:alkylation response protein AidB-like acyl-CoA dehydrogenase
MNSTASVPSLGSLAEISSIATTPEVAMLLETADRMFQKSEGRERVRSCRGDVPSARLSGIWSTLSSLGLTGICAPARLGGSNMDLRAGVLLAELVGRNLVPEPFIACSFFPTAFLSLVEHSAADRLLADAVNGGAMPVMAVDDRDSRSSTITVSPLGRKAVVTGVRRFVHGAAWATHFIVPAQLEERLCAVIVPANAECLHADRVELADGSFRADLRFDGVKLDLSQIIATGADCQEWLSRAPSPCGWPLLRKGNCPVCDRRSNGRPRFGIDATFALSSRQSL